MANRYDNKNIPNDFDWEYYLKNHPDLQKAGLKTEAHCRTHYLHYGQYENRVYKQSNAFFIPSKIVAQQQKYQNTNDNFKILFVQWYCDDNTKENRLVCLKKNINNSYIDHIHIFSDTKNIGPISDLQQELNSTKISISFIKDRLSYYDWIKYANEHYANAIKILINSDIYLDETIDKLNNQTFDQHTFYMVTRKDLHHETKKIIPSKDYYDESAPPTNPLYSHDCWIYRHSPRLSDISILNFKLGYGNCDRLLKQALIEQKINCVNLYPEINAIHIDYRANKQRTSYSLNDKPSHNPIFSIDPYINNNFLSAYDNKLECVALLITGSELQDNQYSYFLKNIQKSIAQNPINAHFAKLLDFKIFCTTDNYSLIDINLLSSLFKKVEIIDINIPDKYNFYNTTKTNSDLTYGYKSGPNYSFFQTFKFLTVYNTTLFLECDCYLTDEWLERIYNYTRFSGSFWISGSIYDGYNEATYSNIVNQHLNGGICLYATGCSTFIRFMDFCFNLLPSYILNVMDHMPYDYVIYQIIEDYFNFDDSHRLLWQFIKRNYSINNLIYNYSTKDSHDTNVKVSDIIKKYNPAIIHKKITELSIIKIENCLNPPEDFDSYFYLSEYPIVQNYYMSPEGYSEYSPAQRAYHHYLLYGQTMGFYQNSIQKNNITKTSKQFNSYNNEVLRGH